MTSPGVLILGNYSQTITVLRSLGKAGYPLVLGRNRDDGRIFTQFSRHASEIWLHPDLEIAEADFIDALIGFLNELPDIGYVFPVWEAEIACLIRHRDRLPRRPALIMAEPEAVQICLDKFRLYEIAASLGIPHTPPHKITSHAELLSAAGSLGYPCVVKNNDSSSGLFGKKAIIAETPEELQRLVPAWPAGADFLVLQKFARGFRHNCHFMADEGRLVSYFEQRVLRTDRPDGTGYGVQSLSNAPTKTLKEYSTALIGALKYSGTGCVQFLVDDRDGTVNFLELNPRLDATCAMPYYCGYDFPLMALGHAAHRRNASAGFEKNVFPYPVGKCGVCLSGDLQGWLREVEQGGMRWRESLTWLGRSLRMSFRGDVDYIWSWTDPLPGLFMYADIAKSTLKCFTSKSFWSDRRS